LAEGILTGLTRPQTEGPTIPADQARSSLLAFAQRLYPRYAPQPFHRLIAEALEAVMRRELDRLAIMLPPRHGKSELASVNYPAFVLGNCPDKRIILASYGDSLARRFSRRARNLLLDSRSPFPAIRPARGSSAVNEWDIKGHRGGMTAAGVGGPITGKGADLLLIDDPVKSRASADSETERENVWEWYTNDAYTRLEDGGRVVMIGTRWHEDDLIGRALNGDDEWHAISLPALAEADDPLGRQEREALWPEKYSVEDLERRQRNIGSRAWVSLFQQRPAPAEGAILKDHWWRYYDSRPALDDLLWVVQSWDTAFKTKQ
jgi:hypothetical protein